MNRKVDEFLEQVKAWKKELSLLRTIILECGLTEDFKWMHPCYTHDSKNVVMIHGFKDYVAILFNNGSLLKDTEKILVQQTANVQYGRQIRFNNVAEIEKLKPTIKAYILEATEVEKLGLKVNKKKTSEYEVPLELTERFAEYPLLKKSFYKLTPGRQRGYLLHFSQAKQSLTRIASIEKHTQRIFQGKGINDCVCGLSRRMPRCDGSHKALGPAFQE